MHQTLGLPQTDRVIDAQLGRFRRSIQAYPVGNCPLGLQLSMLHTMKHESCGKCVPCRDGLPQLEQMLRSILDGNGTQEQRQETLDDLVGLAELIRDTSDCAIGYDAGAGVLESMDLFPDEFEAHLRDGHCTADRRQKIPCEALCPAHVDVPGYIGLIGEGDYAGAVNLIRHDNPLPTACAMICEHPCEAHCRRQLLDAPINIRALKEYAVDHAPADTVPVPKRGASTGRRIAVIGGGPSGLSFAWFASLMGHDVEIFERKDALGGMLRYGIPNYRFPKDKLDRDIAGILAIGGIGVHCGVDIDADELARLRDEFDAVYVGIGAQAGQMLRLEGTDATGVHSAVEMLDGIAHGDVPDFRGQKVIVIGGGNVAMDCTRTAIRCGASEVEVVYRRRREDMTALADEVQGAMEEGAEISALQAPVRIESDAEGRVAALWVQPQMTGPFDQAGRPRPVDADKPQRRIPADVILIAVGQDIEIEPFEASGLPTNRRRLIADDTGHVDAAVYAGGDCVSGPATVIQAIAAGKVAAYNIDESMGYHHKIEIDVERPAPVANNRTRTGRAQTTERPPKIRKNDFEHVGVPMTDEEARQEVSRCLRCDHYGCGVLVGGRA